MPLRLKISKEGLSKLLHDFKVEAYAGGGKYSDTPFNTKRYVCERGIWRFTDEYDGDACFAGMERLARVITPEKCFGVWHMVYSGKILSTVNWKEISRKERTTIYRLEELSRRKIFDFLREALKAVPIDFPFRGPLRNFTHKDFPNFEYVNTLFNGEDVAHANGFERINFKRDVIYEGFWQGGLLMENLDDIDFY